MSGSTPVVLFAHDQPDAEGEAFQEPERKHDINETDKFENLLSGRARRRHTTIDAPTTIEQAAFEGSSRGTPT